MTTSEPQTIRSFLAAQREGAERIALEFHKSRDGDGEYGCPGVTCPKVQKLANLVQGGQLAALLAREQQQGWQPIETAPKDSTFIIALTDKGDIRKMHWCCRFTPDGWADSDGFYLTPTHWMPLPAPPQEPLDRPEPQK